MGGPGTPLPPWAPAVLPQTHHAGTGKATPAALLPSPRPEGRDTTRDTEPQSPRPHCPAAQHADPAPSPSSMAPAPRTRAQSFSATASSGTGWKRQKTVSEAAAAQSRADCRGPRCRARETLNPPRGAQTKPHVAPAHPARQPHPVRAKRHDARAAGLHVLARHVGLYLRRLADQTAGGFLIHATFQTELPERSRALRQGSVCRRRGRRQGPGGRGQDGGGGADAGGVGFAHVTHEEGPPPPRPPLALGSPDQGDHRPRRKAVPSLQDGHRVSVSLLKKPV